MWLSKNILHRTNSANLEKQWECLTFVFSDLNPYLVEVNGIEPMTSCVQSRRSPN